MNTNAEAQNLLCSLLRDELTVLRAKAKISQEEIAEKIGVSRQTYSGIETGRRKMSWTIFMALIAFFQNNECTRTMLHNIDGLSNNLELYICDFHADKNDER